MPKIQIIGPDVQEGELAPGYGTRILMDGKEIPEVRDIVVSVPLDGALTVAIEVLVGPNFSFDAAADLHVNPMVMPGWVLVEATGPDGITRWRAEPESK